MNNDITYWIFNCDNPECVWQVNKKNKDEEGKIFHRGINEWKSALSSFKSLQNIPTTRRLSKREAKSLFPLAFPPHTKEGQ